MRRLWPAGAITIGTALLLSACGGKSDDTLVLGATTSVQDTGLLDEIVSAFENESRYRVIPVVSGSGDILERAKRGELDVILTHSPVDEAAFVAEGYGLEPRKVMENYFVVVGPPDDPARVASASNPADALRAISAAGAPFLSRGDNSGTHKRELATWDALDFDPQGSDWYQESAVNQGQNLLVASDKGAYTLVDSATMTILRNMVDLKEFVIDRSEPNVYTVTLVNPAINGRVNGNAGREFAEFVTGAEAQDLIAQFGRGEYGEALFVPLANSVSGAPSR